jgi:outer membrane protein OmpA-like peptidoglycan-associated protein
MKIKFLLIALFLNLICYSTYGQNAAIKRADKKYEKYAYIDAMNIYKSIAAKGYKDEKMFQKLGNAYYFNGEFEKAEGAYRELFIINPEQKPEYLYRYSQSLKTVGKYDAANKMLEKFNVKANGDKRAILFRDNRNYLEVIKANSKRFVIEDAGINSKYSDFGSSFRGNTLVFATARNSGAFVKRKMKWSNQYFTNLYSVEINSDSDEKIGIPKKYAKKVNSKFNEASAVFTKDGNTMYFTRNNYKDGKIGKNENDIILLKLYKASFINKQWANIIELPFDSDQYSTAHPALSADEKTLFFVSDMPGTFGEADLYKVDINEDGTFGTPTNLGASINTPGRETFPFVTDQNEIYFASDGHPGLGGLDVFVAKIPTDGDFKNIQNLGQPLNSGNDDFAFLIDTKTRTGFFTSNRDGGMGNDDIYKFTEIRKLNCEQALTGVVTDSDTDAVLAGAQVTLFDPDMIKLKTVTADANGLYDFGPVDCDQKYYLRSEKADYETNELAFTAPKISGNTYFPLMLKNRLVKIEEGINLADKKLLDIPMIFFDLDQSYIRKDAAFELEKVLAIMNEYPEMKVDVRCHTDSRQTSDYNMKLSDRRAKSTIAWLIKNGIDKSRLSGRGYGESQLINNCADGVNCSEQEHQANRRSEFVIVSM